ncbi:nucleoside recognition domain-containing protein [Numidum massiliense]|uniref:nucleoside recognition domain-containing protein n=1 Tax=Numidum massiliense TaxID=1522315 RepID=UPI0006D5771A|nr:nucleoside recognition domain-containing protein [Numidum massiliense]
MLPYIWTFFIVSGVIAAAAQGKIDSVFPAVLTGAKESLLLCAGLVTVMAFWLGLMKIAEEAGLVRLLARLISPLMPFLFPDVPRKHPAVGYIVSNISANLFGLGNAATPMGIKAMQALQELNPNKETATPAMCTLLAINTAGVTLIPTMVLGIRMQYGSAAPAEIIGPTLIATCCGTLAALALDRWFRFRSHVRQ